MEATLLICVGILSLTATGAAAFVAVVGACILHEYSKQLQEQIKQVPLKVNEAINRITAQYGMPYQEQLDKEGNAYVGPVVGARESDVAVADEEHSRWMSGMI